MCSPPFQSSPFFDIQRSRGLGLEIVPGDVALKKTGVDRNDLVKLVFSQWDFYTGFYELADLTSMARFDGKSMYNAVAYPKEKKDQIAFKAAMPRPKSIR
jgi:hypothetical protein